MNLIPSERFSCCASQRATSACSAGTRESTRAQALWRGFAARHPLDSSDDDYQQWSDDEHGPLPYQWERTYDPYTGELYFSNSATLEDTYHEDEPSRFSTLSSDRFNFGFPPRWPPAYLCTQRRRAGLDPSRGLYNDDAPGDNEHPLEAADIDVEGVSGVGFWALC